MGPPISAAVPPDVRDASGDNGQRPVGQGTLEVRELSPPRDAEPSRLSVHSGQGQRLALAWATLIRLTYCHASWLSSRPDVERLTLQGESR